MTQGERIKTLRKSLDLTLEKFGERLGVTKVAISNIENGNRKLTEQMTVSICRIFNVNEHWLRTGEGEMFLLPEDEEAAYLADLLEETDNELYSLIKAIMKTYIESGEKEKAILKSFAKSIRNNMKKEDRD